MTTLPPPGTKFFPADSLIKQVYDIVEGFKEEIPVPNDRNRLGYSLYKYMIGEGDPPEITVKSNKIRIESITHKELADKLAEELRKISVDR